MALIRVFEVYGAGWMIAFAFALVHFYRKNAAGELFASLKDEMEKDPEVRCEQTHAAADVVAGHFGEPPMELITEVMSPSSD